jgi:hypothetical protein
MQRRVTTGHHTTAMLRAAALIISLTPYLSELPVVQCKSSTQHEDHSNLHTDTEKYEIPL